MERKKIIRRCIEIILINLMLMIATISNAIEYWNDDVLFRFMLLVIGECIVTVLEVFTLLKSIYKDKISL